jgi:beta-aspartyl-peptidase (threonine type)
LGCKIILLYKTPPRTFRLLIRDPRQLRYHIPVTIPTTHVPTLLVHGGAWAIPADAAAAHETGVRNALEAGYALLSRGGSALDAVEAAVSVLENDPTFDAGRGSFLTSDGRVQLDALLMDGGRMKAGGVACVEHLRNPIQAARLVLEQSPHVYFVGDGAEQFAQAHGMALIDNAELVLDRERERLAQAKARQSAGLADETFSGHILHDDKSPETAFPPDPDSPGFGSHDTVGAVALDAHGNLAAATSTGGTLNKTPGRVGDSSLIGCGCYADNLSAAVSLTGWGEPIMKLVLGKWATDRVAEGTAPEMAAQQAISYLFNRLGGHGGIILLGPDGRFGLAHNTPAMAWGLATPSGLHTGLTA